MSDEQRLRELLHDGLPRRPQPGGDLWDRSRVRYRRARARRRAAGAGAVAAAVLAVVTAVPRLLPGPPEESLILSDGPERPAVAEPAPTPEPLPPVPCGVQPATDPAEFRLLRDLDGDGEREGIAVEGSGLQVARSDGIVTPVADAGGTITAVGLADVDGNGLDNLIVRTAGPYGERVVLARVDDCALEFVRDVQDAPYVFDVGERAGMLSGMGCVDTDGDGELDLVRLSSSPDGSEYVVERTVVEVNGGRAFDSAVDTVRVPAADAAAVALLRSATCGDRPLDDVVPR